MNFTCGKELAIVSMTEPTTCVYKIEATKPCRFGKTPPQKKLEKYQFRFDNFRSIWLTPEYPQFSENIANRLADAAETMAQYFMKNEHRYACYPDEEEEDEDLR